MDYLSLNQVQINVNMEKKKFFINATNLGQNNGRLHLLH